MLKIHRIGTKNRFARFIWGVVWLSLFRPSPRIMHAWRRMLLRSFGAKIGVNAHIYPSSKVWAPWNLHMGENSCLGDNVDCYCVERVVIGCNSTVSQYCFLCTASHDYSQASLPLIAGPILIGNDVWITADVFVAAGVTINDGAVVTARSTVLEDVPAWSIVSGNPATMRKKRVIAE